jgi:hypothetical protein
MRGDGSPHFVKTVSGGCLRRLASGSRRELYRSSTASLRPLTIWSAPETSSAPCGISTPGSEPASVHMRRATIAAFSQRRTQAQPRDLDALVDCGFNPSASASRDRVRFGETGKQGGVSVFATASGRAVHKVTTRGEPDRFNWFRWQGCRKEVWPTCQGIKGRYPQGRWFWRWAGPTDGADGDDPFRR